MPEAAPEVIRLSVPADADLRKVVEVAVAVVVRRMGLPDGEVKAARAATGDAFVELVSVGGSEPIELAVSATGGHLAIRLGRGHEVRDVTVG